MDPCGVVASGCFGCRDGPLELSRSTSSEVLGGALWSRRLRLFWLTRPSVGVGPFDFQRGARWIFA